MFKLNSAHLYYGTSRYPINTPLPAQVPFAPLEGELLEQVCESVARASGCLSAQNVRDRITHNLALPVAEYPTQAGAPLVIPASVQLIGNGFSVIWKE